jgi:molybdenum cofactor cytidylyltransferase
MTTRIAALVLAAGLSTRFAGDKLVHPYRGKPLAAHVADAVATLPVGFRLAVCPAANPARQAIFRERGFEIVENGNPGAGLSSSLILGARRALDLDADALLVCLADMPHVTAAYLGTLLAALDSATEIVASQRGEVRGPPAAFARRALPRLLALRGDAGARTLLATAGAVPLPPGLAADFDTRDDFEG